MRSHLTVAAAVLALCLAVGAPARSAPRVVAPTPPMGWNSWDAFGFTIDEAQFKANAQVLAGLKSVGWSYAVIDEGWYMANPFGDKLATRDYQLDGYGRLAPVARRFPSSAGGDGLKALADWTHAQGLKFGIHILRGIPKAAVEKDLPIAGSRFHATEAANRADTCPWDDGNYGIADNAAGQAYYDALMQQYARWGVDFLKVDCIADHPYQGTELRQIAAAIYKTGRPIVLSLSPGPAKLAHAEEMGLYAQMWRITDDFWDGWTFQHDRPDHEYPSGLRLAFDRLALWNPYVKPGNWPDADMLPFGSLRPHPGMGAPRRSRLSADETRTAFTLWAIARSPLILGANLTELDPATRALLTNREVVALNQRGGASHPAETPTATLAQARVWVSTPRGATRPDTVAVFNLDAAPLHARVSWADLGLPQGDYAARNLWSGSRLATARAVDLSVPGHGVAIYRLIPAS